MKERPILCASPVVRAILDGSKTEIRRVIPRPLFTDGKIEMPYPYGVPGDRLWVKETFQPAPTSGMGSDIPLFVYRADNPQKHWNGTSLEKWKPSIFMPRWASRITLELTSVRAEPLGEVLEKDAKSERTFAWSANPWVSVTSFKRIKP